jgi:signal transduction histidine kinase
MYAGDCGPGPGLRAHAKAHRRVERVKRPSEAQIERAPQVAPADGSTLAERSPRTDGGSSEIVILDGDGVIVAVNQAWRAAVVAYGIVVREAGIGARYVDVACKFLPDLDPAVLELSLRNLTSGGADHAQHTYAIRTLRGPRWRHLQITPLSHGAAGRFVAIHDDQTELALAQEAIQVTSEQLLAARDEERRRIAVELHDSTSQHLVAISMGLARLRRLSPNPLNAELIQEMEISVKEALKETRVFSYLMNPNGLARNGLTATAREFLEGFTRRSGLAVTLTAGDAVDAAPAPVQHAALRIIQEAVSNAYRHARATCASVELSSDDRLLTVSIADDGCGMTSAGGEPCLGVGIPGMHARAKQLSGQLEISSTARGTRVSAWLPLT